MLTTCPECQTQFRLSREQLEARRGMVRCGHCKAVFNAYDTLLPEFESPTPEKRPVLVVAPSEKPIPQQETGPRDSATTAKANGKPNGLTLTPGMEPLAPSGPSQAKLAPVFDTQSSDDGEEAFVLHLSTQAAAGLPRFESPPVMPFIEEGQAPVQPDEKPHADLLASSSRANWIKGLLSVSLGLLSVLLLIVLVAQAVYFLRNTLVVWQPDLRPALANACQFVGCQIPLASDLSAIRVEASSLETDPEQTNRAALRVSFSNRSRLLQQWPHFVLKLTDWQGTALAQRIFRPTDYLPTNKSGQAGLAPMNELEFRLELDITGLSASGYEVLPIYP